MPKIEEMTLRENVPVKDIFLDDSYGRPPNDSHVAKLAAQWNRSKLGVVYVSLRSDGTYACLDGWHRVCACRDAEGNEAVLPAAVYIDLTVEQEAELYIAYNRDRKAMTVGQVFKARLVEGDQSAIAIQKIIDSLDLKIAYDGAPGETHIQAVGALNQIYERYGDRMLADVLVTLRDSMGARAMSGQLMLGMAAFLLRYGDIVDRDRLFTVLDGTSIHKLTSMSRTLRETFAGPTLAAYGMAILQLYNTGLKSKQLPPWQAKAYTPETAAAQAERGRKSAMIRHKKGTAA